MTVLPIVDRELRIASRRRLTYWSRPIAALLLTAAFGAVQLVLWRSGGTRMNLGQVEFAVLKWMLLMLVGLAGIFLTLDTLSEERREGTLGLLFLTDLRGYDIVLGKLISNSLRACYNLLAAFPILGLTLLIGGVTGREFWRVTLVISNTLFLSLAVGMLISSLSRESIRAMNAALCLIVLLFGGLILYDFWLADWTLRQFEPRLSYASPCYLFANTNGYRYQHYWHCLGLQHGLGWVCLIMASLQTPRVWHDRPVAARRWALPKWMRFGSRRSREAWHRKLLAVRPVLWLAMRDRWLARLAWLYAAMTLVLRGWYLIRYYYIYGHQREFDADSLNPISSVMLVLLPCAVVFWTALQSTRFLLEARRTGALELILVTPASPREIVRAQLQALRRTFWFPVMCFCGIVMTERFLELRLIENQVPSASDFDFETYSLISTASSLIQFVTMTAATAWFGMWMGLTNRKGAVAVLKTLGLVVVLPYLVIWFVGQIVFPAVTFGGGSWGPWLSLALTLGLSFAKDAGFILWSYFRLRTQFRKVAAQEGRKARPWFRRRRPPPIPSFALRQKPNA